MANKEVHFYHGVAISRLITESKCTIKKLGDSNSAYLVNNNIALYIKYCSKRLSPWRYTIHQTHADEIDSINKKFSDFFVVLVCHYDGIACINIGEYRQIINFKDNNFPKWIEASRKKNEKYRIAGSDGVLSGKIGNANYPYRIFIE